MNKKTEVKMNYIKFNKAPPKLLLAFAEYILKSVETKGCKYDEKKYGNLKNMKTWSKPKMIKWLMQFDVSLKADKK